MLDNAKKAAIRESCEWFLDDTCDQPFIVDINTLLDDHDALTARNKLLEAVAEAAKPVCVAGSWNHERTTFTWVYPELYAVVRELDAAKAVGGGS